MIFVGEQLRDQVEERLKFYDTGDAPRKNVDVMSAVADSLRKIAATSEKPAKKSKKSVSTDEVVAEVVVEEEGKKSKKDKKDKKRDRDSLAPVEDEVVADAEPKKSKKKKVTVKHFSVPANICPSTLTFLRLSPSLVLLISADHSFHSLKNILSISVFSDPSDFNSLSLLIPFL